MERVKCIICNKVKGHEGFYAYGFSVYYKDRCKKCLSTLRRKYYRLKKARALSEYVPEEYPDCTDSLANPGKSNSLIFRSCLRCYKRFLSKGFGNRHCGRCVERIDRIAEGVNTKQVRHCWGGLNEKAICE